MTDMLEHHLRAALAADADTAPGATGLAARARARAERRRRWAIGLPAAAVVTAGVGAVAVALTLPGSTAPAPIAAPSPSVAQPSGAVPGDIMAMCLPVSEIPAPPLAFDGTVTDVAPGAPVPPGESRRDRVTFTVHEWFRGDATPEATLLMPVFMDMGDASSNQPYEVGMRLLVSAGPDATADVPVAATACGMTWYWDAATAADWRARYGS